MAGNPSSDLLDQCVSRIAYSFRYKMAEMPSSAPINKKSREAWIAIERSQPMPGNTTHSHYRYNRLASFLLADRAQKLKPKYAFLPI